MPTQPEVNPGAPWRWDRRTGLAFGAVVLVAGALRLAHYFAIAAGDPFFEIPSVDGRLYDAWAQALLADERWNDGVLFLGPLYAYFMAGAYTLFGTTPASVKAVQVLLGTLSVAAVGLLARELFDRRVSLLAAAIAGLYGMLVFYGGTLMVVNVQVPLVLVALWFAVRALREPRFVRWLACGLLLGLSALARQTTLLFSVGLAAWLVLSHARRTPPAVLAGALGAFALGVLAPILPFTWQNYQQSGEFVLLNSTGGANLYMGNNARSDGTWVRPSVGIRVDNPGAMRDAFRESAERQVGRPLSTGEVSDFWSEQAFAFVRENPAHWLVLEARKFLLFWNQREVWNNRSIELSRDFSWVLRLPLVSFGVVVPLALVGSALSWRRWFELMPLYGLVATYLSAALIFFVLSRYRMPAIPVLMIFAAAGSVEIFDRARGQQWRRLALPALGLVLAVVFVRIPMGSDSLHMAHYNLGNKYVQLGRQDEAIRSFERSIAIAPRFISSHNNLAIQLEKQGRTEEAIAAWRRVLALAEEQRDAKRYTRAARRLGRLGAPALEPSEP